jgi:hypothetical protein
MPLWLRLPVVGGLLYAVSWLVGHLWAR